MNWDRFEKVVSRASNKSSKEWVPAINENTAEELVKEFNEKYPSAKLYKQIDDLQPPGWYHITEDCEEYGLVSNRLGGYIIYSTEENIFTKFMKSKKLLYTVF